MIANGFYLVVDPLHPRFMRPLVTRHVSSCSCRHAQWNIHPLHFIPALMNALTLLSFVMFRLTNVSSIDAASGGK
jgi:hypothetical protein